MDIKDKESRIKCLFDSVYEYTSKADVANIEIMKTLNNDQDKRWIPIHMIDNANAVVLGISRNKGKPDLIVSEGYVTEKVHDLNAKWFHIKMMGE